MGRFMARGTVTDNDHGRGPRPWLAGSILTLCSLAIGILLAEVGLRLVAPQPMNGTVFEYAPRGYAVIKSKGSALFHVGDRRGVYYFASPHLRGQRQPPAGAQRILVMGDSFTFGVGLEEEDTYVARLEDKIDSAFGGNRVALLNAGIGGSGTAEHAAFVEDFGDAIGPRAVLVFVSVDDFNRAWRSPLYRLRNTESLDLDEVPTSRLKKLVNSDAYNFLIQHLHVAQLVRNAAIALVFPASEAPTDRASQTAPRDETSLDKQRLARALFLRIKAWCEDRGVALAVINNGWRSYDWLPELLASEGIASFDASPIIQPHISGGSARYTIPGDGHPNPEGAALVADSVWPFVRDFIRENGLTESR
jgi:lysophospholipase L1-like esterase